MTIKLYKKTCKICYESFDAKQKTEKYCSTSCACDGAKEKAKTRQSNKKVIAGERLEQGDLVHIKKGTAYKVRQQAVLKNWRVSNGGMLTGEVYGHPKFVDGTRIVASRMVRIITRNTEYTLE